MLWSELFSGIMGSLLTISFSTYRDNQKTKSRKADEIKAVCLLLFFEVNDHLYWLERLDALAVNMLLTVPDDEWKANSHFLALNLPFNDFSAIVRHYRSMRAVRKLLTTNSGYLPAEFQEKYIAIATAAHDKLFNLANLTEENVQAYNQSKKREAAGITQK